jgi:hypothetical protein
VPDDEATAHFERRRAAARLKAAALKS